MHLRTRLNLRERAERGRHPVATTWTSDGDVSSSGIGIAPEGLDRLFKRFSQVDAGTSRLFGGSGLGLAICKSLVEAMGGEIGVRSTPGQGSTLWF